MNGFQDDIFKMTPADVTRSEGVMFCTQWKQNTTTTILEKHTLQIKDVHICTTIATHNGISYSIKKNAENSCANTVKHNTATHWDFTEMNMKVQVLILAIHLFFTTLIRLSPSLSWALAVEYFNSFSLQ